VADQLPVPRDMMAVANPLPRGPSSADEEPGLKLRDIWGILIRNRWVILAIAFVLTGAAVAYALMATRIYEAATTIRIEAKQPNLPGIFRALPDQASEIGTEMQVLRSRSLIEDAVNQLGLQLTVARPKRAARSRFLDGVSVAKDAVPGTYLLVHTGGGAVELRRALTGSVVGTGRVGARLEGAGLSFTPTAEVGRTGPIELIVRDVESTAASVIANLAVSQPSKDAEIVVVRYQDSDPQLAWQVPNTLARRFIERRQETQKTEARSTVAFLRQQIDTLNGQLALSEETLQRFREREHVVDPQVEATGQVTRFITLQADRSTIDAERGALARLLAEVRDSAARDRPGSPSPYRRLLAFPTLLRNQGASDLLKALSELEDQRAALLGRRTMNDPDVQALSARIAEIEEQLRLTVTTYLQGLTNQVASIDTTVRQYSQQLAQVPHRQLEFARLERQPKVLEEMYSLLQTRLKEAEIAQAVEDPSVRVVDPAVMPRLPIKPRRSLIALAGLFCGLLLGVAIAFVRELMDRSIHTRSDVRIATGLPVLGLIPRIPRAGDHAIIVERASKNGVKGGASAKPLPPAPAQPRPKYGYTFLPYIQQDQQPAPVPPPVPIAELFDSVPRVSIRGIGTAVTEAYGSLQTNVLYSRGNSPLRTLVFTSALPGDGKTTNAVNLAFTLAQRSVGVILIDADVRRGVVHQLFGVKREPGLTDVLTGRATLSDAMHVVKVEEGGQLHFLTCGKFPQNPIALLESPAMTDLLRQLREQFEAVILDAPPVNMLTDAAVLGANADGVLIVARAGVTQSGALEYAMQQLNLVRAPVLGVVLNDIDFERDAAYDSSYRYYQYQAYPTRADA
jgi:capsular exopolysaccharide synthesis family protein